MLFYSEISQNKEVNILGLILITLVRWLPMIYYLYDFFQNLAKGIITISSVIFLFIAILLLLVPMFTSKSSVYSQPSRI